MALALRTPLKPGRNGSKSINKAIADIVQPPDLTAVEDRATALEARATTLEGKTGLASTGTAGIVKKGVAVVDATDAATALTQLNALLAALRTSGVITT